MSLMAEDSERGKELMVLRATDECHSTLGPQHTHTCNSTLRISGLVNQYFGLDNHPFNQSATAVLFTQLGTTALQTPS